MIREFITTVDLDGLRTTLASDPSLANKGIPFDDQDQTGAHPLHRICDGVFNGLYTDNQAVEMANILLDYGANINGFGFARKKDTPLIAAASLHADEVALLYIEKGANIFHAGCHGGTALHWAAWCGREKVVRQLIAAQAEVNRKCIDFQSTPLFWAVHGYTAGGKNNLTHYAECARLLVQAGAEKNTSNADGRPITELLSDEDHDLLKWLK
jgi:hypothetical protein